MAEVSLHYIHDPLCGWCYAAAPLIAAAREAGVQLSLHGGGLWAEPTRLQPAKVAYIRESDARIAALTGQAFGSAYLNDLLGDPAATFWSLPTIAAILAAGQIRGDADLDMLKAIQKAHYVDGLRVIDPVVLSDLAAGIGLNTRDFERVVDFDSAANHISATRRLMDRTGVKGFPGFLLETASGLVRLPHENFYVQPAAFISAIGDYAARRRTSS